MVICTKFECFLQSVQIQLSDLGLRRVRRQGKAKWPKEVWRVELHMKINRF